jgi:hypothetical protein
MAPYPPDPIGSAAGGIGTAMLVVDALSNLLLGARVQQRVYRGTVQALARLVAGEAQIFFSVSLA